MKKKLFHCRNFQLVPFLLHGIQNFLNFFNPSGDVKGNGSFSFNQKKTELQFVYWLRKINNSLSELFTKKLLKFDEKKIVNNFPSLPEHSPFNQKFSRAMKIVATLLTRKKSFLREKKVQFKLISSFYFNFHIVIAIHRVDRAQKNSL